MSQNNLTFACPSCRSTNITFDPSSMTIKCNNCGQKHSIVPTFVSSEPLISSADAAGTYSPTLSKTELGYVRITQEISPHSHEEIKEIQKEIAQLKESMKNMDAEIKEILGGSPKVVVLEEISKEEARVKVEEYFEQHGKADIEELMLNLRIPIRTIVEIIDVMKREGKLSSEDEEKAS